MFIYIHSSVHFHPDRIDNKEKVLSHNKKLKDNSKITSLPNDAVYACRYATVDVVNRQSNLCLHTDV